MCCLFYLCPGGAMGWGLSEGQWPQLAMEGPVMNVQRQSRTLQQKHHQFSSRFTARLGGVALWNVSLCTVCAHVYLQIPLCLGKFVCFESHSEWGKGYSITAVFWLWEVAEQCFPLVIPMNPCSLRGTVGGSSEDRGVYHPWLEHTRPYCQTNIKKNAYADP